MITSSFYEFCLLCMERRRLLASPLRVEGIRVVDNPDGCLDFVRHLDGEILVQTQSDKLGRLWVKYANKEILPRWLDVPAWYPVEQAVSYAIELSDAIERWRP